MAGCRLFTGYFVVRIFDSAARHPNSLNSPLPATMPPGTARVRRRSTSSLGGLLLPVAPDDDGFGVGNREYGSFVIGEKTSELLLCPKRNAVTPV